MRPMLEAAGIQWLTAYWERVVREFYASGKRQLTARVGRRGRKSYSWCIVGVAEILTGRHTIPPGDTGVVAVVSADLFQANDRLNTFVAVLEACGLQEKADFKRTARGIEFVDRPYRVQTLAATVSAVSSYTCVFAMGDEVAKWRDGDGETSIGVQVLASWRSTMRTMPEAKMVLLSSPIGFDDPHAVAFALGDTDRQMVTHAPTWAANPEITEAWCRADCETEQEFLRECAAIPQSADSGGITTTQIERAVKHDAGRATRKRPPNWEPREDGVSYQAAIYPCPRTYAWALMIVGRRRSGDGEVRTSVAYTRQWPSTKDGRDVMREAKEDLERWKLEWARVPADSFAMEAQRIAMRLGLSLSVTEMTDEMHESLRLRFASDGIELPEDESLRQDLVAQRKRVTDGNTSYVVRRYAVTLALLAAKCLAGPPDKPRRLTYIEAVQKQARDEEERDYARVRAQNEERATLGHDWVGDIRRGVEGVADVEEV